MHTALKKDDWITTNHNLLLYQVLSPHMNICAGFVFLFTTLGKETPQYFCERCIHFFYISFPYLRLVVYVIWCTNFTFGIVPDLAGA